MMNSMSTKEFWDGYDVGVEEARIEAFAAIRRAAREARGYDRNHFFEEAIAIRFAIRAAIGSERR